MEKVKEISNSTKNEYDDKIKKRVENALAIIQKQIPKMYYEENFKSYLEYLAANIHFDFYNLILLYIQPVMVNQQIVKDRATNVAGYITWQKRNKTFLNKPTGLLVLRPYKTIKHVLVDKIDEHGEFDYDPEGNIKQVLIEKTCLEYTAGTVFDISQTNAEEITLTKQEVNENQFISAMREVLAEYEFIMRFDTPVRNERLNALNGYSMMNKRLIIINGELPLGEKVTCILYEAAKVLVYKELQNLNLQEDIFASTLHVLADSIAYVVATYYHFKPGTMNFHNIYEWSSVPENTMHLEKYLRNIHSICNILITKLNKVIDDQYHKAVDNNDVIKYFPSTTNFNYIETSILIACFPVLEEISLNPNGQPLLDAKGNPLKRKVDTKKLLFLKKYELINQIREIMTYSNDLTIAEGCTSLLDKLDTISETDLHKIEADYISGTIISTEKYILSV